MDQISIYCVVLYLLSKEAARAYTIVLAYWKSDLAASRSDKTFNFVKLKTSK